MEVEGHQSLSINESSNAQESRFIATCKLLNLETFAVQNAWNLLQTLLPHIENVTIY